MFNFILYLISLIRLKWINFKKKLQSRFDNYTPNTPDLVDHHITGLLANKIDWNLGAPNLERKENISIIGSNTFDKSALNLRIKWRPHGELNLATLLTQLSLELDGKCYDYEDTTTYAPSKSTIEREYISQYGSNGSHLKLFILRPYTHYRIVFRGYMKERSSTSGELCFVKLNLLAFQTSKVYDFKEQYNTQDLAHQISLKGFGCDLDKVLNKLVLHDRHEQTLALVGEYAIDGGPDYKKRDKLYLWAFHARQFIDEQTNRFRSKRILAHFVNGRAFHLAIREDTETKFDPTERFAFGFACFRLNAGVAHLDKCANIIDWDIVNSNTLQLSFQVSFEELNFKVNANRRDGLSSPSEFMDMNYDGKRAGWGAILINDALDSGLEVQAIDNSLKRYQAALKAGTLIDLRSIEAQKIHSRPLVVDIDEPSCCKAELVGAKGSSLAQLRTYSRSLAQENRKYLVSNAVMLTRFAYETIQELNPRLNEEIKGLEARVGRGELEVLDSDSERIRRMFESEIRIPDELRAELGRQLRQHFQLAGDLEQLDGRSFAVRSSSWGEDEDDMSAAGQLSTILGVKGFEKLLKAVLNCYASKFSQTNLEYKRQHGMPLDLPMAVIVQEMIECDRAGVMFTSEPTSGNDALLSITANYGLGESVVSGQTDPDYINVRADMRELDIDIDRPNYKLSIENVQVGQKKVISSTQNDNNDNYDRQRCCLDESEMLDLSRCGLELANYFAAPRDIEWGYKDKQLYLFQARPITGLDSYNDFELLHEIDTPSRAELEFLTRANVGEVKPFAEKPFSLTYNKLHAIILKRFFTGLGIGNKRDYTTHYSGEIIANSYHLFFGLRGKTLLNFARPKGKRRPASARAMDVGIFGRELKDEDLIEAATDMFEPQTLGLKVILKFAYHLKKFEFFSDRLNQETRKQMKVLSRDVQSLRLAEKGSNMMEKLFYQMKAIYRYAEHPLINHILCAILSTQANYSLIQILEKYIKDPIKLHTAFSQFLASSPNVLSAEIPRRIEHMAELIKETWKDKEIETFVGLDVKEGFKFFSRDPKSQLSKEFDIFMDKFGHRSYNELEIAEDSWRKEPEKIIELIQTNVRKYLGNSASVGKSKTCLTNDEVIKSLVGEMSFLDRVRLKYFVVPKCQKLVSAREQTKDIFINCIDCLRDASRLLAREMRQNNRIPDENLFYYLLYKDVEHLIREPQPALVAQATKRRRMFREFKNTWHYDEIIRGHEVLPLHKKPSKELDESLANADKLYGTTASSGIVRGRVCLVNGYEELKKVKRDDILLTYSTDIAFSPIFPLVSGVITEVGGLISHGAVVAREYGLPSIIGIPDVTKILHDEEEIILDANNGTIIRLGKQK